MMALLTVLGDVGLQALIVFALGYNYGLNLRQEVEFPLV
jgi:hypothetical protein